MASLLCHGRQQCNKLFRVFELVLSLGGSNEEAAKDRLGNVHRIELGSQTRVVQAHTHGSTNDRLETTNELRGSRIVSKTNALHKRGKLDVFVHLR